MGIWNEWDQLVGLENKMIYRPILFSGPMVRALLDGSKTQTRRIMKIQNGFLLDGGGMPYTQSWDEEEQINWRTDILPPFGPPGDQLYVRETWFNNAQFGKPEIYYRADGSFDEQFERHRLGHVGPFKWRPSIHMPRSYSRIKLKIVKIRAERLHDISEADAKAEGVLDPSGEWRENLDGNPDWNICPLCGGSGLYTSFHPETLGALPDTDCHKCDTHKKLFKNLWESINGTISWDLNPWVWVIEFKRV